MSAWVKQLKSQVEKLGNDKASWHVFWYEPDGTRRSKSCGAGAGGRKNADRLCERRNAELLTGQYNAVGQQKWSDFKADYKRKVLSLLPVNSMKQAMTSLNHLERILKLKDKRLSALTSSRIADFVSKRQQERGKKPNSTLSPATVNSDLRQIKAALRVAVEWKCLQEMPRIKFVREPERLPRYVSQEHFALIYAECTVATLPDDQPYLPEEWWRGLLVMAQMTGWRKSELMALKWDDVDLDKQTALTRASDNKGKRDQLVTLHPVVIDHLQPLRKTFHSHVFPWNSYERKLYDEFAIIQEAAGIKLPCHIDRPHDCTDACHRYGFHDERRAFATENAPNMTREALQTLMRHKSPLTTARYIDMAQQLKPAVAKLKVPEFLQTADVG